MGKAATPTERDQFWLNHESKIAKSERTAKAYAAEQGLSLHAAPAVGRAMQHNEHDPTTRGLGPGGCGQPT